MYRIFDSHVHIYPDKIAAKASDAIGDFYHIKMNFDGGVQTLLERGAAAGVSRFLVHSVATSARQVISINDFLLGECALYPDKFIGFATLHPDFEDPYGELKRVKSAGLHGVKLHPDFQKFEISDAVMDDAYAAMAELNMPVLFHTGDVRYNYSNPAHVPVVLKRHPGLTVICAHLGGYSQWDEADECLKGSDVYVDTSSSQFGLPPERVKQLIYRYGTDRVLFGSDYPMWDAKDEIEQLLKLGLTPREYEMIFAENLAQLLGE